MRDDADTPGRCESCSKPLSGRATRSCSAACRQALYRAARALPRVAADEAAEHHAKLSYGCHWCGEPTGWAGIGRQRRYCSDRCRVAAFRDRKLFGKA